MNNTDKDNEQHLNKKIGTNIIRSYFKKIEYLHNELYFFLIFQVLNVLCFLDFGSSAYRWFSEMLSFT